LGALRIRKSVWNSKNALLRNGFAWPVFSYQQFYEVLFSHLEIYKRQEIRGQAQSIKTKNRQNPTDID
jgi:hypothetical protein